VAPSRQTLTGRTAEAPVSGLDPAFAALARTFADAAKRLEPSRHRLRVGPQSIELQIAGEATAEMILPALAHVTELRPAVEPADLVVQVWSTLDSDTRLPDLASGLDGGVGNVQYDGAVCLSVRPFEATVSALHTGRREAVHCVADAGRAAPYDIAHPLSEIFAWSLSREDCYRVHAAAVGTVGGGVLFAGPSGAGKSTSALTCLQAGMRFAGDDTVLVRGDPPVAISLYNTGRADRDLLARYPHVFPRLDRPSGEAKAVGFFSRGTMAAEIPLRAVVLPRVVPGGRCAISVTSRANAMLALAPWVALHSPGGGGRALAAIRRMINTLPAFALEVGDDLAQIPVLISDLIKRLG
jgi:hypothetical protein